MAYFSTSLTLCRQFYEFRRETTSEFYDIRRMSKKEPATLFGRRLRDARQRVDIPQDRLGIKIGLDEGTASARLSRYETGAHEPPFKIALKLARALSVPTAYFYCEDEDLAGFLLQWQSLTKAERRKIVAMATDRRSDTSGS
jgi:transcriptional regulator with XRE-family HTH domain